MTQPPKSPVIRFVANSATIVVGDRKTTFRDERLLQTPN
jgi:hypothetical protein